MEVADTKTHLADARRELAHIRMELANEKMKNAGHGASPEYGWGYGENGYLLRRRKRQLYTESGYTCVP